jgi:hypothetical protein
MPRLSEFFGISIYMYWADHGPAHFHAIRGDEEVLVAIADGDVLAGRMAPSALTLIRRWLDAHRHELEANWERARALEPMSPIDPLR